MSIHRLRTRREATYKCALDPTLTLMPFTPDAEGGATLNRRCSTRKPAATAGIGESGEAMSAQPGRREDLEIRMRAKCGLGACGDGSAIRRMKKLGAGFTGVVYGRG
jgi:hypothetical protein